MYHPDESPRKTALALAIGVFLSFTPFWGFQTLLALLLATVFRLNRAVTVTGTWLNLPWFAPFVYAGAVKLGALMLPDLSGPGRPVGLPPRRQHHAGAGGRPAHVDHRVHA